MVDFTVKEQSQGTAMSGNFQFTLEQRIEDVFGPNGCVE
jgi:hypothetical protein